MKSFLIYIDTFETLQHLTDEQLGKLTRMLFKYKISGEAPEVSDPLFMAFGFIKTSMDRDAEKWNKRAANSKKNGAKGGRPKENKEENIETQKTQQVILEPTKPVSVSVSVSGSVSDIVNKKKNYRDLNQVRTYIQTENLIKDQELLSYYIDFIEMKLSLKKSVTEKSIQLSIKKLRELSGDKKNIAIKIIENSIEANWQTFYPLKDNTTKNEKPTFTRASTGLHLS